MHRIRPVCLLPAILAMALALTSNDIIDDAGIAFIGDSLTLGGLASAPNLTFTSLISQHLDREGVKEEARFFLSFEPGTDIIATRNAVKQDRRFIIIELGAHAAVDQQLSYGDFRSMYGSLLDCVTGGDAIVVAGTVPWLGFAAGSTDYQRADALSQIITEEAAKRRVAVADIWSAMKLRVDLISTPQEKSFLSPGHGDDLHPNDSGHAVIAQLYEKAIDAELANPPSRPFERQCH